MAWTGNFIGVDYKKRAEFLHNYLKQRPDGLEKCLTRRSKKRSQMSSEYNFRYGYKTVLSFIMSSLCVRSEFRYVSTGANERLKEHGITKPDGDHLYNKKKYTAYKGLTSEHTIPVKVLVEHLASLDKKRLTVDYLTEFLEKVSGIAIITVEENKKLNKGLKDSLPNGITLDDILQGKASHCARYKEAGLDIAKTDDEAGA